MEFDVEWTDEILERIAEGESLVGIIKSRPPGKAGLTSIYVWLDEFPGFAKKYARACKLRADTFQEKILEVTTNPSFGAEEMYEMAKKFGIELKGSDMIQHRRLLVDSLKWTMAKCEPKKYGDVKASEGDDGTVKIEGGLPD